MMEVKSMGDDYQIVFTVNHTALGNLRAMREGDETVDETAKRLVLGTRLPTPVEGQLLTTEPREFFDPTEIVGCKACEGTGIWSRNYPGDRRCDTLCPGCRGAGAQRV